MKQSHYNYTICEAEKIYCFNGLTKQFFSISQKNEYLLKSILDSPISIINKLPHFYNMLIEGGFIIADDVNELNIIRAKNKEACNSPNYNLVILPTLNCNFRCWYCYENHTTYKMSEQTVEKIQKYIQNIIDNNTIKSLNIEWFGGEPFLHFKNIIKPISLYAKNKCQERNILFSVGATSNGYLINEKIAKEFVDIDFKHIQITLDGEKSLHDKTRVAPNGSSFEKILKNINFVCEVNPIVTITIRINYDEKNFLPSLLFSQIKESIDEKNHHRCSFLLRKVWQVEHVAKADEKILEFIQLIKESSFNYNFGDFNMDFMPCYAAHKNMKLITPYGSIGKCTAKKDFEEQAIGFINDEGVIKWGNNLPFDDIYATPLFENEKCLNCKKLPLCMGNCPKNIDINGNIFIPEECKGSVNDLNLSDAILNYCKMNEMLTLKTESM